MRPAARLLPVLAIWAAAAVVLAVPVRRVVDWFVMTDELLYERLAFSVARSGSPLPSLHGEHVPVANQLYPLLLSVVVGHALVPAFLVRAHTLNAVVMTSAALPAFLLARDTVRSRLAPYMAAALAVSVPWLVLASFVLSEAVAYPAFLWGVYLVQRAVARPSPAADALALGGLVLAFLARTQFVVLVAVAALAILLVDRSVRRHGLLVAAAAAAAIAFVALAATGHAGSLLGTYSSTAHGSLVDPALPKSFTQHAATLALALALLPPILGAAWLGARAVERQAAATVSILAILLVLVEVTSFDLRYGGGLPRDRYLFYVAPLLLVGFLGALEERTLPRWSLVAPIAVVGAGIATAPLPVFAKLNVDTPAAILDDYIVRNGGRSLIAVAAVLLLVLFVVGRLFLPVRVVAVVLAAATLAALLAETAYAFDRLFRVDSTSGRPVTLSQGGVFDWVDRTVGTRANVTMIPYAQIAQDYWATAGYWWDLEFWNRAVTRASYPGNRFAEIQSTFPKLPLSFDAHGFAHVSPTRYVAQSDFDTRFRIAGPTVSLTRDVRLIDAGARWRASWTSAGLDDDGFARPGRPVRVDVYPQARQAGPLTRYLTFEILTTGAAAVDSGTQHVALPASSEQYLRVTVCVPARGHGTVTLHPHGASTVYGDLGTRAGIGTTRVRSFRLQRISLADETAPC